MVYLPQCPTNSHRKFPELHTLQRKHKSQRKSTLGKPFGKTVILGGATFSAAFVDRWICDTFISPSFNYFEDVEPFSAMLLTHALSSLAPTVLILSDRPTSLCTRRTYLPYIFFYQSDVFSPILTTQSVHCNVLKTKASKTVYKKIGKILRNQIRRLL